MAHEVLINQEEIADLVDGIAQEIVEDHKEQSDLYFVTVLMGARTFSDDLQKRILGIQNFEIKDYEIRLSSYGKGTESSKNVRVPKDIEGDVQGQEVIIVEDIVDTGRTLDFLKKYLLNEKGARSVKICSLLSKPSRRDPNFDVPVDYLGREIKDLFVFGYGIDMGEKYRELTHIAFQK